MQVLAAQPFTAQLAVSGDPDPLGARVELPVTRAIVSYWRAATIDPVSEAWTVTLDAPPDTGEYLLVWRTGDPEPPTLELFVPLTVIAAAAGVAPTDPAVWRPSVEDVAAVTPAYTRGGYDDDTGDPPAGAERATYDHTTTPTAAEVGRLIDAAVREVAGRVGVPIRTETAELARQTAVWHAAAAISAGKIPANTDDASGEYRSHITNYRACLDELIRLSRVGGTRLH